jgi:hypothetical protein
MDHFTWARACAESFRRNGSLRIVVIGAPEPSAIAALTRDRDWTGRLHLLGEELFEPIQFVHANPASLAALAEALVGLGAPLHLKPVFEDSPLIAALEEAYRGRGIVVSAPCGRSPWIPLGESWSEPERHLKPGRRSDLRRAFRIAERMGPVSWAVEAPRPSELGPLLEEAFRVEAAGWKGREGSALAADALRGDFYRRYAAAASERGILRIAFLRIGGRAAAMQLAVECGGGFWLLKIGYDEAFSRCSPGMLLTRETIRHAALRGLETYEFLGQMEAWTRVWTDRARPWFAVRSYPFRVRALWAFATDASRFLRNRLNRLARDRS